MPKKNKEDNGQINLLDVSNNVIDVEFADIMQQSYIDYAMSVIVSRALPDVRDGLKPVQRRILYDMKELGTGSDKPYRKSARIVGDTMGKYHPHGDSSIYGAMVVLAQDFKMGQPLVDGHGNFGSIEGDGAAAMRYTEARLQKFTENALLSDMDKNTIDFQPNFDETEKEPSVLPARYPNFLVNGSEGIAVGMTTSTPPHNLGEIIDATIALIKKPNLKTADLMQYVPGPDFPTGGIVANMDELPEIYETGQGKIKVRGTVKIEKASGGKSRIVITQIPYTMIGANIGKFLNDISKLIEDRVITDIADISNQSSKEGIRIVLDLKKDADAKNIVNILYTKTKLEDTFGVNMLAIVNGKPEVLSLRDAISHSIDFQYELNTRKYQTLLAQALKRKEIQEGLIKACDCIDLIIEILRGSKDRKQAKECMVNGITANITFKTKRAENDAKKLRFTDAQADAILDMRLYKLIGLEINALKKEYQDTLKQIDFCNDVLNSKSSMSKLIIKELSELKKNYATERKTLIENSKAAVVRETPKKEEKLVALIDRFGYIHSIDTTTYERNKDAADESYKYVISTTNKDKLFLIADDASSYLISMVDVPYGKLRDKGVPIDNISSYNSKTSNILGIFSLSETKDKNIVFCTQKGFVKKVPGSEFAGTRKVMVATKLEKEDKLISAALDDNTDTIVLITANSFAVRFKSDKVSILRKNSVGNNGINLGTNDKVTAMYLLSDGEKKEIEINGNLFDISSIKITGRNSKGKKI